LIKFFGSLKTQALGIALFS